MKQVCLFAHKQVQSMQNIEMLLVFFFHESAVFYCISFTFTAFLLRSLLTNLGGKKVVVQNLKAFLLAICVNKLVQCSLAKPLKTKSFKL